jgi:hypothetical protein
MMDLKPLLPSTTGGVVDWEWVPADWPSFLRELDGIVGHEHGLDHLLLFRGQRQRTWLLDATFARACKTHFYRVDQHARLSDAVELTVQDRRLVTGALLFKFGIATRPSPELFKLETERGIDPWFEWMRRLQQYPDLDQPHPNLGFSAQYLPGTFIMDWTQNSNVALYFANGSARSGDGALWVVDASATGKTLHRDRSVRSMLDQMETTSHAGDSLGVPLIFHPRAQIAYLRAKRQEAVYVAQMELVYDLAEVWGWNQGQPGAGRMLVKLVLPAGTQSDCTRYLAERGITQEYLFPN